MRKHEPLFWTSVSKYPKGGQVSAEQALVQALFHVNPLDWKTGCTTEYCRMKGLKELKQAITQTSRAIVSYWNKGYDLDEAVKRANTRAFEVLPRRGWWKVAFIGGNRL